MNESKLDNKIINALKTVFDPEIPVDIYELGLIYKCEVTKDNDVLINMTLTSPNCPVAGELPQSVKKSVEAIDEVNNVRVDIVWEPPWDMSRMSEVARLELDMM
mgnify:FL=1